MILTLFLMSHSGNKNQFSMKSGILLCILFFLLAFTGQSQIRTTSDKTLQKLLDGKKNIAEVMQTVTTYYAQVSPGGHFETNREFKKWMRWAHEALRTAGPGGSFGTPLPALMDLYQQEQTQLAPNNSTPEWNFSGPSVSSYQTPVPSGLNGLGRCDRIAFHPTNPNIIYVGTPMGGLWRTTDGGLNWSNLTSFLPVPGVSGIAIDPSNPNTIYLASGNADVVQTTQPSPTVNTSAGIFKSTDGGASWKLLTLPWDPTKGVVVFRIAINPTSTANLLIATSDGLYRSLDGGNNWTDVYSGRFFDVEFVAGTSKCYFTGINIANQTTVWYSPNGGVHLVLLSFSPAAPSGVNRIELAVNSTPLGSYHHVYAFAGPVTGNGSFKGLYRMNASGQMALVRNTPNLFDSKEDGSGNFDQSGYDQCMTVKPTNPEVMLTGGAIVFRSVNGGVNMPFSSYYNEPGTDLSQYIHPDIHDIAYNPLNNFLYAATDGGFYKSTNDGTTWENITNGIATSQFYHIAGYEPNHFHLMGGLQDNGVKYKTNSGGDMIHIAGADGFYCAISPSEPKVGYLSANGFFWRLNDLPNKNDNNVSPTTTPQWSWRMQTDPVDGSYLYASDHVHDSIWISDNGGNSWFRRRFANGNRGVAISLANVNRVYALGGSPIFDASKVTLRRSENKGDTWSSNLITTPGGLPPLSEAVPNAVAVSPVNSNILVLAYSGVSAGNKVFLSADAGANWVNISYNLPNIPVNTVQIDNGLNMYIGTDYGVYHRRNGASSWLFFSNGLPRTVVNQLVLNQTAGIIYAATFGRGIYYTTVYSPCLTSQTINTTLSGEKVFEVSGSLTSNAVVGGGEQTKVFFKSNNEIRLTEGFMALDSITEFKATLGPCGSGFPVLNNESTESANYLPVEIYPGTILSGYTHGYMSILQKGGLQLTLKKAGTAEIKFREETGNNKMVIQTNQPMNEGVYTINVPETMNKVKGMFELYLNGEIIHIQEWIPLKTN
jgi:photosystem II stability/assembly factor-like uncharacterized protein